jgi:hypothetical protein
MNCTSNRSCSHISLVPAAIHRRAWLSFPEWPTLACSRATLADLAPLAARRLAMHHLGYLLLIYNTHSRLYTLHCTLSCPAASILSFRFPETCPAYHCQLAAPFRESAPPFTHSEPSPTVTQKPQQRALYKFHACSLTFVSLDWV